MLTTTDKPGVAYAILCHESHVFVAEQFAYIWSPGNVYFYHVDLKAPAILHRLTASLAAKYDNVFVVPAILCSWAGFSLVQAMLELVTWAVRKGDAWTHLVFLSEQHLPLASHAAIRATLKAGVSYLACVPFDDFSGPAREDLLHRFSGEFVEVAGVGAFHVGRRDPGAAFLAALHHGSQWMILARSICVPLSQDYPGPFWDGFRASILADETAIQTWIARHLGPVVSTRIERHLTLVSAPIDGGDSDMTFNEVNFFTAVDKTFLFIRKRPVALPDRVSAYLAATMSPLKPADLPRLLPAGRVKATIPDYAFDTILASLNGALLQNGRTVSAVRMPRGLPGPPLFALIQSSELDELTRIFVMSGDLISFKVIAVSRDPSDDHQMLQQGNYETTLLRVRGVQVWHHREIHFGHDLNAGMITISSLQDIARLATLIETFLQRSAVNRTCQP